MAKTFIITALAVAALGAGITPVLAHGKPDPADPAAEPTHVAVAYADLDLGSPAGQTALHQRIARAASEACLDAGDGLDMPRAMHEQRACRNRAMLGTETRLAARGMPMHH